VPPRVKPQLKPRKQPIQARSATTVAALHEASIQVLRAVGYRKFTTTRVAERAGVSVGTLYQYFPNREALIAAVIDRYLADLANAIDAGCLALRGKPLEDMVRGFVDTAIAEKWARIEVSRALHEPLADIGGTARVYAAAAQTAGTVAEVLQSCRDASFAGVRQLAFLIVISCSAVLQAAMSDQAGTFEKEALRAHMQALILGYLRQMRAPKPQIAAAE
jgi:AcrR family transcriptional regulator